jgi:hypothetical protein
MNYMFLKRVAQNSNGAYSSLLMGKNLWQGGVIPQASMMAPKSSFLEDTIQPLSVCQMYGCSTLFPWSGSSRILIKILVLSLMVVILHQVPGQVFQPLVGVILQPLLGIQCSCLAVMAATVTQDATWMIFIALMFERGHGRELLRRDGPRSGALATNPVRLKHHCSFWGAGMLHNNLMIFS